MGKVRLTGMKDDCCDGIFSVTCHLLSWFTEVFKLSRTKMSSVMSVVVW